MNDPDGATRAAAPTVLLADNDANVAAILREFLVRRDLAVEIVEDGRAALDRVLDGGVALLVCDLDMPVMSGDELLEALRDEPCCPPVVVISGYVDDVTAAALGAHPAVRDVLRKPFDVRAFAMRVEALARDRAPGQREPGDPARNDRASGDEASGGGAGAPDLFGGPAADGPQKSPRRS